MAADAVVVAAADAAVDAVVIAVVAAVVVALAAVVEIIDWCYAVGLYVAKKAYIILMSLFIS